MMRTVVPFIISALIALPFVLEVFKAKRKTVALFGRHYHTHFWGIPNGYKYLPSLAAVALVLMLFGIKAMCIALAVVVLLNWLVDQLVFSWQLRSWRAQFIGLFITYGTSFVVFWMLCLYRVLGLW